MMKRFLRITLVAVAAIGMNSLALAEEEPLCLECHEPAEDWEGMSRAEVLTVAMDQTVKMHKDHKDLTEEQLKIIIATLLPDIE